MCFAVKQRSGKFSRRRKMLGAICIGFLVNVFAEVTMTLCFNNYVNPSCIHVIYLFILFCFVFIIIIFVILFESTSELPYGRRTLPRNSVESFSNVYVF